MNLSAQQAGCEHRSPWQFAQYPPENPALHTPCHLKPACCRSCHPLTRVHSQPRSPLRVAVQVWAPRACSSQTGQLRWRCGCRSQGGLSGEDPQGFAVPMGKGDTHMSHAGSRPVLRPSYPWAVRMDPATGDAARWTGRHWEHSSVSRDGADGAGSRPGSRSARCTGPGQVGDAVGRRGTPPGASLLSP